MAIRESLELDVSSTQAAIDRIQSSLEAAAAGFGAALNDVLGQVGVAVAITPDTSEIAPGVEEAAASAEATAVVVADTDEIPDAISASVEDADAVVEVTGATDGLADEIDAAIDAAAGVVTPEVDTSGIGPAIEESVSDSQPVITPEVDSSQAVSGLNDLTNTAKSAGDQLGKSGQQLAGFATNATASATSIGALSGGVASLGASVPIIGGLAAGFAGLAAFIDKSFESAVNVQAGVLRADQTFGQFRDTIEHIQVGNLDVSLQDLSLSLGSSTTQVRQAAATFGQLGIAAGKSPAEIAKTTAQLEALSARAVALNPALGSVGDVMETIGPRLARGGRFAGQLSIALSAAEINARASADANGKASDQLTVYEKTAAAAALATEKLGGSLQQDIARGTQNPVIQLRQLEAQTKAVIAEVGAPLVAPVFDILRESQPVIQASVRLIGQLAKSVLPAVAEGARSAGPGIVAFTNAVVPLVDALSPLIVELAKVTPLFSPIAGIGTILEKLGISSSQAATQQGALTSSTNDLSQALGLNQQSTENAAASALGSSESYAKLQQGLLGVVDAEKSYRESLAGIDTAQKGVEQAARGVAEAHKAQEQAARGVIDAQRGVTQAQRSAADAGRAYEASLRGVVEAERQRETALHSAEEAQRGLVEAQRALTQAQAGPSERDTLDLAQARLDAQEAEAKATATAADATANATEKERARIAAGRARLDLADAEARVAGEVGDAQAALAVAQERVIDAQRGIERADQGVRDAHQGVADAAQRSADAQLAIADAQQRVVDAQDAVGAAALRTRDAEDAVREATKKVADARDAAARAAIALADARSTFGQAEGDETQNAEGLLRHLQDLKNEFPELAPQLDPLINKFNDLKSTVAPEQGADVGKGFVDGMTGTVGAAGPQLGTATSQGFAGIDFQGLANDFGAGLGVIRDTIANKAVEFKDNVLGWVDTAKNEAPGKLAFLSGEFAGWAEREILDTPKRVDGIKDAALSWIGTAVTEAPGKLLGLGLQFENFAKGIPGIVISGIGDVSRLLIDKGKDIIRGLLQGIIDIVNNLPAFLNPIKDQFISGFRDAFDSHSPARVMTPIGEDIGAGVIEGLSDSGAAVVAEAEKIVRDAQIAISKAPAAELQINGNVTGAPPGAGGGVFIQSLTVTVPLQAGATPEDARRLAAAAADSFVSTIQAAVFAS